MADNVFNENQEYLIAAKNEVKKRDDIAEQIDRLKSQHKKMSKAISSEKKSISDEITQTVKKRKQEITESYDKRLDDNRTRKKKVENKRDKKKTERINKRIEGETKHINRDTKDLMVEMKSLFKKEGVPAFCSKHIYYIMFGPKSVSEVFLMLVGFVVYFAGIPAFITLLCDKLIFEKKDNLNIAFWCVLVAAIIVIVQLLIYFALYNSTKNKHRDAIEQGRCIWDKINANKRQEKAIRNSINKDKDESQYKLGAYDEQMASLDNEADDIIREKQAALKEFEEETAGHITDEINHRRQPKLESLKAEKDKLEKEMAEKESMYSDQSMLVTKEYASYLGEDLCKYERILDLISLMEDGQADTVSDAISIYKGVK
jgi:gas vesicle protein